MHLPSKLWFGLEEGNSMTKETQEVLRKFITQQEAADYCNVTVRTIRNWIADGFIKGYRMPGGHLVRIDLDELTAAISTVPTVKR